MMNIILKGRNVFLAYSLKVDYKTMIEGLNRRFPDAWQDRERYEYFQHPLLRKSLIYDEYISNLSYCLFEKSNEQKDLANALLQLLIKKEPKIYRTLKAKGKSNSVNVVELLDLIQYNFLQENFSLDQCCKLATVEFLSEQFNLEIESELFLEEFNDLIEQSQGAYLLESNEGQCHHFMTLKRMLRKPNSELSKRVKSMLKQYTTYLNVSPSEMLHLSYLISKDMLYVNENQFLNTTLEKNKLTQQEALEVICLLRCLQGQNEVEKTLMSDTLTEDDFAFFDEHIGHATIHYLISEQRKQDADFFFKHYVLADEYTIRKLEQDVEKLKDENEKLCQAVQTFEQTKEELANRYEKNMSKRMKDLDAELVKLTRLNARLEQENMHLKKENEMLLLQINSTEDSEQDLYLEIELEPTTDVDVNLEALNNPSIMIIGGAVQTIQRLKQKLPNCKYFECDHKYNDDYFTGINQAILLTNIVNHSMTLRFDKLCPKVPKKSVKHTNVDLIIKEIAAQKE
ncbi:MAG TPA: hypothetical protein DCY20_11145, partial [Firmicutes bacterium]|nr:hypothetical protein [Bacillota bacterium]